MVILKINYSVFKRVNYLVLLFFIFILGSCQNKDDHIEKFIDKLVKDKYSAIITIAPVISDSVETYAILTNTYLYKDVYLKDSSYFKSSFKEFLKSLYYGKLLIDKEVLPKSKEILFYVDNYEKKQIINEFSVSDIEKEYFINRGHELVFKSDIEEWQKKSLIIRMFKERYFLIFDDYAGELITFSTLPSL